MVCRLAQHGAQLRRAAPGDRQRGAQIAGLAGLGTWTTGAVKAASQAFAYGLLPLLTDVPVAATLPLWG